MAGLSVAFHASCEDMWLAWRHGAALVPGPRSLVRSGMELGPWLMATISPWCPPSQPWWALWPAQALAGVRLLILGGEACPPELAARLVAPAREVWNTYGPTETTVVACGVLLDGGGPVRIGLPLGRMGPRGRRQHGPTGGLDLVVGRPMEDQAGSVVADQVAAATGALPARGRHRGILCVALAVEVAGQPDPADDQLPDLSRRGGIRVLGRGQTDMRGLGTAGWGVRQERNRLSNVERRRPDRLIEDEVGRDGCS